MSERVMPYELVTTDQRLEELLDAHDGAERYAFDTEFDNRRTYYARLALVQIAWPDFIMLVDPFSVDVRRLERLFGSNATAIAHAASNDLTVLDRYLGVRPQRLFDTQVAAQLVGLRGSSLAFLASELLSLELDKSEQTSDWTIRPLSASAELYATNDVAHLFDIADELFVDLTALGRVTAFDEECEAVLTATTRTVNVQQSWWNLQNREQLAFDDALVAQYLAATREELAEMLNLTRRYLLSDDAVLSMAAAKPRTLDGVRALAGRRVDEQFLPQFLDAIRLAEAGNGPALELPSDERHDEVRGLVSLLQALVWQTASALNLEPSFLASKNDLLARLDGRPSKMDRGWRQELITSAVDAIIDGSFAVAWRSGALQLVDASEG
jgi:ribonuclease D